MSSVVNKKPLSFEQGQKDFLKVIPPPIREVLWKMAIQAGDLALQSSIKLLQLSIDADNWHPDPTTASQLRDSAGLAPASPLSLPIRGKGHLNCTAGNLKNIFQPSMNLYLLYAC